MKEWRIALVSATIMRKIDTRKENEYA